MHMRICTLHNIGHFNRNMEFHLPRRHFSREVSRDIRINMSFHLMYHMTLYYYMTFVCMTYLGGKLV